MISEAEKIRAAFLKGLFSTRSRGGVMDETSHQNFHFIGMNSGSAQHEINQYLLSEKNHFEQTGVLANYLDIEAFLQQMTYKYAGCTVFVKTTQSQVQWPQEKKEHEKNESDQRSSNAGPVPKVRSEGVHSSHEVHAPRRQNHQNSKLRGVRKRSRKTKKIVDRKHGSPQPLIQGI